MNEWLASNGTTNHDSLDLEALLTRIKGHDKICFTHNGRQHVKTREEITVMIHTALCSNCNILRAELYFQRTEAPPDAFALIRRYINDNYTVGRSRKYNRRLLYDEVAVFLKSFGLVLTKDMERFIIRDVLNDDSRQYRKLRIERVGDVHMQEK